MSSTLTFLFTSLSPLPCTDAADCVISDCKSIGCLGHYQSYVHSHRSYVGKKGSDVSERRLASCLDRLRPTAQARIPRADYKQIQGFYTTGTQAQLSFIIFWYLLWLVSTRRHTSPASVAQRQSVGLERYWVRNSLVPSGFPLGKEINRHC